MSVDWQEIRRRFPAVDTCCYLNTAAGAPISRAAAAAGAEYYDISCRDGDVHWDAWMERVEQGRASLGRLLHASPREIGFVASTSVGMSLLATMLWGQGSVALLRGDFPSVTLPWMQQGFDVRFMDPADDGSAPLDAVAAALGAGVAVVALGSVHYRTGTLHDIEAIGHLCHRHGALLLVDFTQHAGAVPIDLSHGAVDFAVGSGYKWLTAGYGVGFVYVHERHLRPQAFPAAGWRSARDPYALVSDRLDLLDSATALELGNPPFAGVLCLESALRQFEEIGATTIGARVLGLSGDLIRRLDARGLQVVTPADDARRAGIVSVRVPSPEAVSEALERQGVLASVRGDLLRLSTHFYNHMDDLERLDAALDDTL